MGPSWEPEPVALVSGWRAEAEGPQNGPSVPSSLLVPVVVGAARGVLLGRTLGPSGAVRGAHGWWADEDKHFPPAFYFERSRATQVP